MDSQPQTSTHADLAMSIWFSYRNNIAPPWVVCYNIRRHQNVIYCSILLREHSTTWAFQVQQIRPSVLTRDQSAMCSNI